MYVNPNQYIPGHHTLSVYRRSAVQCSAVHVVMNADQNTNKNQLNRILND